MATIHSNPSVRFNQAVLFSALLFAFAAAAPFAASAQQSKNPDPKQPCGCSGGGAIVAAPTNAGTEFLLCYEENLDANFASLYSSGSYLEVYVASIADTATVTITCKAYPSMNKTFFLQPNSSFSYRVTDDTLREGMGVVDTLHNLWVVSDEVADNTVVQVDATSPIVCYGMDYKSATADAFCALAKESAATSYAVMSYPNSQSAPPNTASQFAVASFYDDDTVTITPSAPTLGGKAANVPFQVVLQEGQCVQVQTDASVAGLDLTGSTVRSTQAVTVYSGHQRTEAPVDFISPNSGVVSRDMLLETMPPTSTWGQSFVLNAIDLDNTGTIGPNGDLMRVLALNDNTSVTVNGKPWVTLNHNQFSDSLIAGPTLVTSSGPLLVGEIEHSDYYINGTDGGDPSLSIVPPVDQTFNNYTFFTSPDNTFGYNSVIIATDTNSQGAITLDGTLLPSFFFTPVPGNINGRAFSIYEDQLMTSGAHTISSSMPASEGFTILVYGLGDVISYGYTAGELLVPKRAIMIDPPPESIGPSHTNTLTFHSTAYQPAYLDSAIFTPDNPDASAFGIHVQEDVATDIGRMDVGASAQIHLISDNPLPDPISGTVTIYSHLPSYLVLEPAVMHFTLYPNSAADVSPNGTLALTATATPNPFSTSTTINFSIPTTGDITLTLYDELGRVVQHVASGEYPGGQYSIPIYRRGLANGVYVCEITSDKLNIHTRVPIVAGE